MTKTKIKFFKLYRYKNTKKFQNIYILNQIHIFLSKFKMKI